MSKNKEISDKTKEGIKKSLSSFKEKMPKILKILGKTCKYALIGIFALAVLYCLKTEPWSEGYLEGMTYQDEAFCDALMEDESFTVQDFYVIRQYYNNGETKAQFCSKLIGIFDSQYQEYLEENQDQSGETENQTEQNNQQNKEEK